MYDLPKELMAAFRATLVELEDADVLIHLVDISNPQFEDQMDAVHRILGQLKLDEMPRLLVFNKIDRSDPATVEKLCLRYEAIGISAIKSETLTPLIKQAQRILLKKFEKAKAGANPGLAAQPSP